MKRIFFSQAAVLFFALNASFSAGRAADIIWTNTAGGSWSAAANWNPNQIPGATNTVVITNSGTYTVTISSSSAVSNLIVGAIGATGKPSLTVSGTLTLGGHATFETNALFNLVGGTVQTMGSVIDVRGLMNWNSGLIVGAGRTIVTNTGTISFNSSVAKVITTNNLENYGTFTYGVDGDRLLDFSGGAMLTNQSSGVINIGSGIGYNYSGTPSQRSYLVNYGTISCAGSAPNPGTIYVELVNYGTLAGGFAIISRGTNYGTISSPSELVFLGNPTTGEYFSFEPGTTFTGQPNIAVAGLVQWDAPNTIHNGLMKIGATSGGYTSTATDFRVNANYTNTVQVSVRVGTFTIPTNRTANLHQLTTTLGGAFYVINNLGTIVADNVSDTASYFANSGLLFVRTNLALSGGSFYNTGRVTIASSAVATFSGGAIDAETFQNYGTVTASVSTPFTGNSYFENEAGGQLAFTGGSLATGPATLANFGTISGYGGLGFTATNFNSILADDSLNRTLSFTTLIQQAGVTDIRRGLLAGNLQILGGLLTGTNTITGSVLNAATISPGRPFGRLTITGNYTNAASGLQLMPIGATNLYPQIRVSGNVALAGTLKVTFTNGFYPVIGNTFTSLTFSASSGVFDTVATPGYEFEKIYNPTNFLLRGSNSLPIMSLTLLSGSTQMVCTPFRIAASGTDLDGAVTNVDILLDGVSAFSASGAAANTTVESDSPLTISIVARGRDDRNGYGYATQQVSILNYSLTNVLFLGGVRTNNFKLCIVGEPGRNYEIYGSTNLETTNWVDLGIMGATNGTWHYVDQSTITNRPYRFYRAQQLP